MGNSRFTFNDCARLQGLVKHKMQQEQDHEDCHTAWLEAENELATGKYDADFTEGIPTGYHQISTSAAPPKQKAEPPVTPRKPPCLEHREIVFQFKDGSQIGACSHSFCDWGFGHEKSEYVKFSRKHSDGTPGGGYAFDLQDESPTEADEEQSAPEIEELNVAAREQARVAGEDEPENFDSEMGELEAEYSGE